jgi:hypothetical protein
VLSRGTLCIYRGFTKEKSKTTERNAGLSVKEQTLHGILKEMRYYFTQFSFSSSFFSSSLV